MVVERRYSVGERNRADKVAKIDDLSQPSQLLQSSPLPPSGLHSKQVDILLSDRAGGLCQQTGGRDAGPPGGAGQVGVQQ